MTLNLVLEPTFVGVIRPAIAVHATSRQWLGIFLSALLFCGCSHKHTAYVDRSIDIVAGKDIVVGNSVVSVKKRDGSFIEGIQIVRREANGKVTIITADTGKLTQGPEQSVEIHPTDTKTQDRLRVFVVQNPATMILSNPFVLMKTQSGTSKMKLKTWEIDFK